MEHQWIAAQVGDVIKKVESHYGSEVEDGEHFAVLDVFNGDDTAVVLGRDGKLKTLVFPEEYKVVGKVQDLLDGTHEKSKKFNDEVKARISEEKANGTYVDVFEKLGIKVEDTARETILERLENIEKNPESAIPWRDIRKD